VLAAACVLLALGLAAAASAESQIYRYVDSDGVVHFTNVTKDASYSLVSKGKGRARMHPEALVAAPKQKRFDRVIARAARLEGLPPALVKAVIHAESAFDPNAVSRKGAMGLMQLMPATAAELGVSRPFSAEQNVRGGSRYLRQLHDRYEDWKHTLAAYNAGPGAVDRYEGIPPYAETRAYVDRVLSYYRRYHVEFPR
jgi:soluble lytic murein transglycosylase-like protein